MHRDSIERVQASHQRMVSQAGVLSARFYSHLFELEPQLRPLFPSDLSRLERHFEDALSHVMRNLSDEEALGATLRSLGAQHLEFGAQPRHYFLTRQALLAAMKELSAEAWSTVLEDDWRRAISVVSALMLQGAAMETAVVSERFSRDAE